MRLFSKMYNTIVMQNEDPRTAAEILLRIARTLYS